MGLVFPWCEEGSFPSWDDFLDEVRGTISEDREASCAGSVLRCSFNRAGSRLGGEDTIGEEVKMVKVLCRALECIHNEGLGFCSLAVIELALDGHCEMYEEEGEEG